MQPEPAPLCRFTLTAEIVRAWASVEHALGPGRAAEGRHVADLIIRRPRGQPLPPLFRRCDEDSLAIIGCASAAADFGHVKLTDWLASMLVGSIHIFSLISLRHRVAVFFNWFWSWLTYGSLVAKSVPARYQG